MNLIPLSSANTIKMWAGIQSHCRGRSVPGACRRTLGAKVAQGYVGDLGLNQYSATRGSMRSIATQLEAQSKEAPSLAGLWTSQYRKLEAFWCCDELRKGTNHGGGSKIQNDVPKIPCGQTTAQSSASHNRRVCFRAKLG